MMVGARRLPWGTLSWLPFVLVSFGPAFLLLVQSFRPGDAWSLDAYREGWLSPARWSLLANSLKVGAGVVLVTLATGIPAGFLLSRTRLAGRGIYQFLFLIPLLIPPYIAGLAWTQIALWGGYVPIVLLLSATCLPVVIVLAGRGFRDVGRDAEDAARQSLGTWGALRSVTLPLARGSFAAAALLTFVLAITDFSAADFFSFAGAQEKAFQVFAMDVYARWKTYGEPEVAIASAVPLVVVAALGMWLLSRLEGRRSVASVRGAHRSPRPYDLGRWGWLAHVYLIALVTAAGLVPLGVFGRWIVQGIQRGPIVITEGVTMEPATPWSVLNGPSRDDLLNSLLYASLASALLLLVAVGPAWSMVRGGLKSRGWLAVLLLPLAFPSLLVGMAQIEVFNRPGALFDWMYTGGGLVVFTLLCRYLPLGVLGLRAAWQRLDVSLEEAARVYVVGRARRGWAVLAPLLLPGVSATFVVCTVLALRDLDSVVLLDGAQETLLVDLYGKIHYARDAEAASLCLIQIAAVLVPWAIYRLCMPSAGETEDG